MIESRRRAYLDAMGLDVWTIKPPAPLLDRLILQPGAGETLLICQQAEETALRIAADIVRAIPGGAVWAWPDPAGCAENLSLGQAIDQCLFTRVVLFGDVPAQRLFSGESPAVIGSARVLFTLSLDQLAVRGNAKLAFWQQLSVSGTH